MRTIANDDGLIALVDELFFEYHFVFDDGIEFGWKKTHYGQTVDEALALMRLLRARGGVCKGRISVSTSSVVETA